MRRYARLRRFSREDFVRLRRVVQCAISLLLATALVAPAVAGTVRGRVEMLEKKGLVRHSKKPVKVLGEGDAPKNLTLVVDGISAGARSKIEQAGGTVEIV